MIVTLWKKGVTKGYRDVLPHDWFSNEIDAEPKSHEVLTSENKITNADCFLTVKGATASLQYPASQTNRDNDIEDGIMELRFLDGERTRVESVLWNGRKGYVDIEEWTNLEASEGSARLALHLVRERVTDLRNGKIQFILAEASTIACEACGVDYIKRYPSIGLSVYEVHHLKKIAEGKRLSGLADLAVLCSNCHRMIHRTKPMLSVERFRDEILGNGTKPAAGLPRG